MRFGKGTMIDVHINPMQLGELRLVIGIVACPIPLTGVDSEVAVHVTVPPEPLLEEDVQRCNARVFIDSR
jgi:hypothetical protein